MSDGHGDGQEEAKPEPGWEAYLGRILELPFVRAARFCCAGSGTGEGHERWLELSTSAGPHRLRVVVRRTQITASLVEQLLAQRAEHPDLILFAPHVGRGSGHALAEGKVQFMDLAGNCYVRLDDSYVARVQGNGWSDLSARERAWTAPAYRVLFALLAQPGLLNASARDLAVTSGGVSPQAVLTVRERLVALGALQRIGARRFEWSAQGRSALFDLWTAGARAALYPKLVIGRYRARETDRETFEARVPERLHGMRWAWGGGAAAHRLMGQYRGTRTLLYVDPGRHEQPYSRVLALIPDVRGAVMILRAPGPSTFEGSDRIAHPLLVYTDLLQDPEAGASDAAVALARERLRDLFTR